MKALIVDDNAGYRAFLRRLLAEHFPAVAVAEAESAPAGLMLARSGDLDLVFMDLRLPEGNGFALTRALKQACPRCIVCVISSYELPEYRQAAFENGADRFLAKGASTACDIVAIVESVLHATARG